MNVEVYEFDQRDSNVFERFHEARESKLRVHLNSIYATGYSFDDLQIKLNDGYSQSFDIESLKITFKACSHEIRIKNPSEIVEWLT